MMRKTKYKLLLTLGLLIVSLLTIANIIAWKNYVDQASHIKLQVTKINSEIYMYQAIDTNYNGIPDLLSDYTQEEINNIKQGYPTKDEYYNENKAFRYLGMQYAMSNEVSDEEVLNYSLGVLMPSQTKSLKFSAVNKSDGANDLRFRFDSKTYSDQISLNLIKCLSVRIARVYNNTFDTIPDITSSDTKLVIGDKVYFKDYITTSFTGFTFDADENYSIEGSMLKDDTKNDNVLDVLLQFTFEPYDTLIKDPNFTLTYDEYSSVVGKTVDLPDLKVVLELNVG
jgi:hypothetical protein